MDQTSYLIVEKGVLLISLLLLIPIVYMLVLIIVRTLLKIFFPHKIINITVINNGIKQTHTVKLDDSNALVKAINESRGDFELHGK
ncbi:hypothetical protein [Pseudoalteromonas denitrificans]|uniref:Uncharacterized protein n=1 Tax=Pseudoalteromonas denitrificans DSM 6059 TaxID=1123010 RepID=A0A1I1T8G2_9GAMM|nr:hypothetical protein [Pseudoalteromonas denitrificans]SFD54927.1 hypothetical protein SAMN02745724_04819 [Pseudoalteromonas denitrificans DSM 6059]